MVEVKQPIGEKLDVMAERWYQHQLRIANDYLKEKRPWYVRWLFKSANAEELVGNKDTIILAYKVGATDALGFVADGETFTDKAIREYNDIKEGEKIHNDLMAAKQNGKTTEN